MIKIYIVTYKRNDVLNRNLSTLWNACRHPDDISVTIISNHPDVIIDETNNRENLSVTINNTRALNSWGYLSRDWNFGILDCFTNWRNPNNVEWCVLAQNDVEWVDGWDDFLRSNKKYDFISQPRGDQSIAININAVRKVGFFDERFCTLHFQEYDYFARAMLKLGRRASINDDHEGEESSWNPIGCVITKGTAFGFDHFEGSLLHTSKSWEEMKNLFIHKWGALNLGTLVNKRQFVIHYKKNAIAYPKEINWYPFFWDGYTSITADFLDDYAPAPVMIKTRLAGFVRLPRKEKIHIIEGKLRSLVRSANWR